MRQRLQGAAVRLAVERSTRPGCIVEGELSRLVQRAGRGHALERIGDVFAGKRLGDRVVSPRGEDERKGRGTVAQVDSLHLPGRVEVPAAVEDVVGDLEGNAEREAEVAET